MSEAIIEIVPTLVRFASGKVVIVEPADLAGRVTRVVEAPPCRTPTANGFCCLLPGHTGAHWNCSPELLDQMLGAVEILDFPS